VAAPDPRAPEERFVSRAGAKLLRALEAFALDVTGLRCADFGCNVGGFTDCLLQRGAAHVTAIDTGYGSLAWKLRQDPRVEVRERTNALHAEPPAGGVDLVVVDLAWTPQRLAVPAALRWLAPGGRIVTLVKPHYELLEGEKAWLDRGFLPHDRVPGVVARVEAAMPSLGARVAGSAQSPLVGGKTSRKAGVPGNVEWLVVLEKA
jgi:23S rRNA (cytidine1920-2'-O)/16S rRNA (cytidine1409-2'-O)-methyltransferase